jgi:hypothetical protein
MEAIAINPAQRLIIESFAATRNEEELNDLMDMLRDFYATRLKQEMRRLWDNGTLDQSTLDTLAGEHFRTPYRTLQ